MNERRQATLALMYLYAKREVLRSPYGPELLVAPLPIEITEPFFLRELGWVVLSAGMAEYVVRRKFPNISESFLDWESGALIAANADQCFFAASAHFAHVGKLRAIIRAAEIVATLTFDVLKQSIIADPISTLQGFPYLGPATSRHLAKNLGVMSAKPDRHLERITAAAGHNCVQQFCQLIGDFVGDDVRKVDSVLWRYATLYPDYIERLIAAAHARNFESLRPDA